MHTHSFVIILLLLKKSLPNNITYIIIDFTYLFLYSLNSIYMSVKTDIDPQLVNNDTIFNLVTAYASTLIIVDIN